jgi:hypothetical protein
LLGLALLGVTSCGGAPPHPPYAAQATIALTQVDTGPPPGRIETIPPRPAGADAWVDGEWVLRHGRWYWLLGRWVKTPSGARYAPWVLVRASDGTAFYAPGVWRNATGQVLEPPPALALATASHQGVVSPEGDPEETGRNITQAPRPRPPPEGAEHRAEGHPSDTNRP